MAELAPLGRVLPSIIGLMGVAGGAYHLVRNVKVFGGELAMTVNDEHEAATRKRFMNMPREGSERNVVMNPITNGIPPSHVPQ